VDDGRRIRVGHAAFGLAFVAIGAAWLLRGAGLDVDAAWLAAVTVLALGVAGLATVLSRLVR
jgi:hypothetical protein